MKLKSILLVGLLGVCMPLTMATSCGDKPPVDEPEVQHHPTSSFDKCPLLAHIDNPKLGIKEMRSMVLNSSTRDTSVLSIRCYDAEQKMISCDEYEWDEGVRRQVIQEVYKYDQRGRLAEAVFYGGIASTAYEYDQYGFLAKETYSGKEDDGSEFVMVTNYFYNGDTVRVDQEECDIDYMVFNNDMLPVYFSGYTDGSLKWKNGNYYGYKSDDQYAYDDKINISKLTDISLISWYDVEYLTRFSKNNLIRKNCIYTYNSKNLLETVRYGDAKEPYIVYSYLYY